MANATAALAAATGSLECAIRVGPLSKGPIEATSVPFRAIWARRFLADLDGSPGLLHLLAQTLHLGDRQAGVLRHDTTAVFEKTSWRASTASFFSALSTLLSPVDGKPRLLRLARLTPRDASPTFCACPRSGRCPPPDRRFEPQLPPRAKARRRNPVFPVYAGPRDFARIADRELSRSRADP